MDGPKPYEDRKDGYNILLHKCDMTGSLLCECGRAIMDSAPRIVEKCQRTSLKAMHEREPAAAVEWLEELEIRF